MMGVKDFVTITSCTRYLHNRTIYFGSEGFIYMNLVQRKNSCFADVMVANTTLN